MDEMHAIQVSTTGGPEVLEWSKTNVPRLGSGQALVRVVAAGINFIDTYHRNGLYPMELPFIPGVEGAGIVESVADDVGVVAVGDRVCWSGPLGSYAQYAALPADKLVQVPDEIELELAAAVLLQGLTAHYLALDTWPLRDGQTCLIHAGAGGVGLLLIQVAKMLGATVYATTGTAEKAEIARGAGADEVIDYTQTDFAAAIEQMAGEKSLDVIYDGVGAATVAKGLDLLRPRGMMVTFGNSSGPPPDFSALDLMRKGSLFVTRPTLGDYVATRGELERRTGDLFDWIAGGKLNVRVGARFPLAEAADAHTALEGRETTGKVLLEVANE
jgi:NADPH2:quinone reductase